MIKINRKSISQAALGALLCGLALAAGPVQAHPMVGTPGGSELKARPPLGKAIVIVTETEEGKKLDIDGNRIQILAMIRLIGRETNLNVIIDKDAANTWQLFDGELFKTPPDEAIRFFAMQAKLTCRKIDDETFVISRAANR